MEQELKKNKASLVKDNQKNSQMHIKSANTLLPVNSPQGFKAMIFDWDGTAIPDRYSDAWSLINELEDVLRQGVICAIITGTSFKNVNEQATRYLSPLAKKRLYVCTNRGSEVYG